MKRLDNIAKGYQGMSDNDIFREVEQDIAQENLIKFWKKNQKLIMNAIIGILLVAGGYGAFVTYKNHKQEKDGLAFTHALELAKDSKTQEAELALSELVSKGSEGYALLARLKEASLKATSDKPKAIELYKAIAADANVEALFQSYAQLMLIYHQLDTLDVPALETMVQPLLDEKSSWRFSALELAALIAQKGGNLDKAKTYFNAIVEDEKAPHAIRARAGQMVAMIQPLKTEDKPTEAPAETKAP